MRKKEKIDKIEYVDLSKIHVSAKFQRPFEEDRCQRIMKSIKKRGYRGDSVISCAIDGSIIDGQHRYIACKRLGIGIVPVSYIFMETEAEYAAYFLEINSFSTALSVDNKIKSLEVMNNPLANTIASLRDNKKSPLYQKINDGVCDSRFYTNSEIILLLDILVLGRNTESLNLEDKNRDKYLSRVDFVHVCDVFSKFFVFFSVVFSSRREVVSRFRRGARRIIVSLACFYKILQRNNLLQTDSDIKKMAKKIKSFDFQDGVFLRAKLSGRLVLLVEFWNEKDRNPKIEMYVSPNKEVE